LSASLAISALLLYVPATTLPMLRIEQLGHRHEDSLLSGVAALFAQDYWLVGTVVLLFSVILPPLKLAALLVLASAPATSADRLRAALFRAVESLGRWGMLDVMLVAILVAYVKLGDLVSIEAGPGLLAFTLLVLLSLLASMSFNPHMMWNESAQ
jgi:paraquat-inducible protein A